MKLAISQQIPTQYNQSVLQAIFRALESQGNLLAEGRLSGRHFNATTVPTAGDFAKGDLVWEANPTVMGSVVSGVAADYVRLGWICTASGSPGTLKELRVPVGSGTGAGFPAFGQLTSSLGSDVALSNTANYFDGPSVSQGSTGTWFASGTVTVDDTAGAAIIDVKLWDGTTVIASARTFVQSANRATVISLSGFIASPAGNLRMSVKDGTSTSGKIVFNASGNSKDSTITAFRLA